MISIFVTILVGILLIGFIYWVMGQVGIPHPFPIMVAGLLIVILLLYTLKPILGVGW